MLLRPLKPLYPDPAGSPEIDIGRVRVEEDKEPGGEATEPSGGDATVFRGGDATEPSGGDAKAPIGGDANEPLGDDIGLVIPSAIA